MVKISNFTIISITLVVLIAIITITTTLELNKRHETRLIHSMQTKVEYYAKRCYLEKKCEGMITLKDLYERDYLTEVIHPVTKEIVDENITISFVDKIITINW